VTLRLLIVLLMASMPLASQLRIGTWDSFTDQKQVRAVAIEGSRVWAATSGGVFVLDTVTSAIRQFTNTDGLTSNDLLAIHVSSDRKVWVGASDGSLNVLDPESEVWYSINDIRESTRRNKAIRGFAESGDTLLIAGEFGVSVYLLTREEFADTYFSFGFSGTPLVTSVAIAGDRVWVGSSLGVAFGSRSSRDLTSPSGWTIRTAFPAMSASITALAPTSSGIVAGSTNGACIFDGVSATSIPEIAGRNVTAVMHSANNVWVLSNSGGNGRIDRFADPVGSGLLAIELTGVQGNALRVASSGDVFWIGTATAGIATQTGSVWSFAAPNGPNSNQFIGLAVADDGAVWCGSGLNGSGKGFYRYQPDLPAGERWKNFTLARDPALRTNDYYKVSVGLNGSVWISSWGNGVVQIIGDSVARRIDANSTPSLAGAVANNPQYVVAGSVVPDAQGDTWFVVRTAINGNHLSRMVNETTFVYYQNQYNTAEGLFQSMVIDRNGTKWLGNSEPSDKKDRGLYFFNEERTVSRTRSTGGWGYLGVSDGLSSNSIICFAVDNDGDVWVGMDLGVTIITNPLSPRTSRYPSQPLREQSIQAIAVDAVNNKWVGTKEGVFVVSPDGTQLIAQYTVASTFGKLLDNDVRSIAIDQRRGIVYLGTEKGLSALRIAAVQTKATFSTLEFGPNPYLVPSSELLVIRGLVENASIKIMTPSGSLVKEFRAQGGGRAFWDGTDERGNTVASGVYFVIASADNGASAVTGTVAVVRR